MDEYYEVQWYNKDTKKWLCSWGKISQSQVEEYLRRDRDYFWNDIPIRVVKFTLEVVQETMGTQQRPSQKIG